MIYDEFWLILENNILELLFVLRKNEPKNRIIQRNFCNTKWSENRVRLIRVYQKKRRRIENFFFFYLRLLQKRSIFMMEKKGICWSLVLSLIRRCFFGRLTLDVTAGSVGGSSSCCVVVRLRRVRRRLFSVSMRRNFS